MIYNGTNGIFAKENLRHNNIRQIIQRLLQRFLFNADLKERDSRHEI